MKYQRLQTWSWYWQLLQTPRTTDPSPGVASLTSEVNRERAQAVPGIWSPFFEFHSLHMFLFSHQRIQKSKRLPGGGVGRDGGEGMGHEECKHYHELPTSTRCRENTLPASERGGGDILCWSQNRERRRYRWEIYTSPQLQVHSHNGLCVVLPCLHFTELFFFSV